jgi:methionyl-tRNA formyltransferase
MPSDSSSPIKLVFMGTPAFSVPCLQSLLDSPDAFQVVGVLTQPDKPAERGQQLTPPPIKLLAQSHGIPVHQPKSLRKSPELIQWLRDQNVDFFVTIAFGQILSQEVLDIPQFGTVNVHASLLPAYRGANPIQQAMLEGAQETGLTTMLTDIGVDTGKMLKKHTVPIAETLTCGSLTEALSLAAGPLLKQTLLEYKAGTLVPTPQEDALATHAPKVEKTAAFVSLETLSAEPLRRCIQAQNPWPGVTVQWQGQALKLHQARQANELPQPLESISGLKVLVSSEAPQPAGTILALSAEGILLQCHDAPLWITELQPAGKKRMNAADWARNACQGLEAPRLESMPSAVVLSL